MKNINWEKALMPLNVTVAEVIHNLNETYFQIALIVSPDGILIGTVTDGDIRRSLLSGLEMNSSIDKAICREPLVVSPELGREMVLQFMQTNQIYQLPVVDEEKHVVGLHLLSELIVPVQRSNLMVIMAGGQGTRLRPRTNNCPKPLLPVDGKPILEHIIERAKIENFKYFVVALHYLGHMIEEYFGDGSRWQVKIEYIHEKNPLGTAGAIGLLKRKPDAPFVVSNGDVLTDIRYGELLEFHCRHKAEATMAVGLHELQHPFGVVRTNEGNIIGFEEKPVVRSHVNAGVYVLNPSSLDFLSPNEHCDMPTLFDRLRATDYRTIVYPIHETWIDVGYEEDLKRAKETPSQD